MTSKIPGATAFPVKRTRPVAAAFVRRLASILRLNWTRSNLAGFSFEAGIEGALNTLDHQVQLFEILPGGGRDQIDLPVDQANVKEKRAEAFIRAGRQISPALRLDAGINYEYSKISVRGDVDLDRTAAQILETQPDARLEGRQGLAWPVVGPPHGRPARFLRFHQLGRTLHRPHQRRQRRPGAAADLGVSRLRSNIPCSATAWPSSTLATT